MKSRADELRKQHRRMLAWALAAAGGLHAVLFLLLPGLPTEATWSPDPQLEGVPAIDEGMVDVRFGPPQITTADGAVVQEPSERRLQVVRLMRLPANCDALRQVPELLIRGSVRLRVDPGGYAEVMEVVESTGYTCADQMLVELAGDLQYHWLPSERFPAPVHLVQPVTLVEVVDE